MRRGDIDIYYNWTDL